MNTKAVRIHGKNDLRLEPGTCHPDGRDVMRKEGKLKFLAPGESITYEVTVEVYEK